MQEHHTPLEAYHLWEGCDRKKSEVQTNCVLHILLPQPGEEWKKRFDALEEQVASIVRWIYILSWEPSSPIGVERAKELSLKRGFPQQVPPSESVVVPRGTSLQVTCLKSRWSRKNQGGSVFHDVVQWGTRVQNLRQEPTGQMLSSSQAPRPVSTGQLSRRMWAYHPEDNGCV